MDCPEDDIYRYPFVEGDTNVLVYAIHDTITFVNQNFDEITFVCVDKTYWPYSTGGYDGSGLDCGHNTYYVSDRIEFVFKPYGNSHQFVSYVTKDKTYPTSYTTMLLDDYLLCRIYGQDTFFYVDSILYKGDYLPGVYTSRNDSIGLYNKKFGIIRFKDKDETIWELKEKK
ncbi:MAG: hypothetical protein K9I36_14110 [Bacteroidia bacterium]|nr:hypothetical protein [Bacteroidia bacterium]MCF8427868.1 hypothetical protein [Bacteroidia bacterium]